MPAKTSLNVSLTPELEAFVHSRVSSGRYSTASEVVREALRLMENTDRDREGSFANLKEKLSRGALQADQGKFVDPQSALKQIAARKRTRTRSRARAVKP